MSTESKTYWSLIGRIVVIFSLGTMALKFHEAKGQLDWLEWVIKLGSAASVIMVFGRWVYLPLHRSIARCWSAIGKVSDMVDEIKEMKNDGRMLTGRLRFLLEQSTTPVFEFGPNGEMIMANKAFCDLAGLTEQYMLGRGWLESVHEYDRQGVWNSWQESRNTGVPWSKTFRLVDQRTKSEQHVQAQTKARIGADGSITSYDGVVKTVRQKELSDLGDGRQVMHRVAEDLARNAYQAGTDRCASLDVTFDDGKMIRLPLIPDGDFTIVPGVRIRLLRQDSHLTEYQIKVDGNGELPWHRHQSEEIVTVKQGTMEDEDTGRIFGAGETWVIPPGHRHSVRFRNAIVCCQVKPGLPSVREVGMDMSNIESALGSV